MAAARTPRFYVTRATSGSAPGGTGKTGELVACFSLRFGAGGDVQEIGAAGNGEQRQTGLSRRYAAPCGARAGEGVTGCIRDAERSISQIPRLTFRCKGAGRVQLGVRVRSAVLGAVVTVTGMVTAHPGLQIPFINMTCPPNARARRPPPAAPDPAGSGYQCA